MEDLKKKLCDNLDWDKIDPRLVKGFALFGAFVAGKAAMKPVGAFYRHFLRPRRNLKSRYGDGWAVVTGASDGIGKAFAIELARAGFKVALVARNKDKTQEVADEIKSNFKVETKVIVYDFNKTYTEETFIELDKMMRDLGEISILVNNVGVAWLGNTNLMPNE
jgi:NADPH:quinone reductase-like Zn-dependent oxidoreductase